MITLEVKLRLDAGQEVGLACILTNYYNLYPQISNSNGSLFHYVYRIFKVLQIIVTNFSRTISQCLSTKQVSASSTASLPNSSFPALYPPIYNLASTIAIYFSNCSIVPSNSYDTLSKSEYATLNLRKFMNTIATLTPQIYQEKFTISFRSSRTLRLRSQQLPLPLYKACIFMIGVAIYLDLFAPFIQTDESEEWIGG